MKQLFFIVIFFMIGVMPAQDKAQSQNNDQATQIEALYIDGQKLYAENDYEQGFDLINKGFKKAQELKDESLIAYGYLYKGAYYQKKSEPSHGVIVLQKALSIFTSLNNQKAITQSYFNLGDCYASLSQFDKAFESYFTALKREETINNAQGIGDNLSRIGELYLLTADYKKARANFNQAMEIYIDLKSERDIMFTLTNLGACYQKEGSSSDDNTLILKAIETFKIGLEKARNLGIRRSESVFLGNIGSSYRRLGNYQESLEYLFMALPIKIEQNRYTSAAHTCNDISETYISMNKLAKAKEYALKAISYANGYSIHQERYAYYILSDIESKLGNYKSAMVSLKKYQKLEDSIFSIEKIKSINELAIAYETEKKNLTIQAQESDIALLDSKNKLKSQWMIFGGLGLLSFFSIFVLYRSKKTTQKEKLLLEQFSQNLLVSQEDERVRIARELHDSVGQQLTLIKKKSQNLNQDEITKLTNATLEEVRSISRGLYPALLNQLGLTESIEQLINDYDEESELFFSMDIDNIDAYFTDNTSLNYYRLIQECLTNIVKHAKAKSVTVNIKKEGTQIVSLISDNGKGFDVNDSEKKNSLGLKTIFERIKIMNGNLSIDSRLNNGTSFLFSIPIKNE